MPTSRPVAVVEPPADGNNVAVGGEGNGEATLIAPDFAIDINAALHPNRAIPGADAGVVAPLRILGCSLAPFMVSTTP